MYVCTYTYYMHAYLHVFVCGRFSSSIALTYSATQLCGWSAHQ